MVDATQAQFYPAASLRVTDLTLYNRIRADYGVGLGGTSLQADGFIVGASPATLAVQYGLSFVNNPVSSDYANLPGIFTLDSTATVQGNIVSNTGDGIQTMSGVSYTDANGQVFTSVTWTWVTEVVLYSVAEVGHWNQQVVTWTGDGTSGRLIPTTFDLRLGRVAIWGFSQGVGATLGFFRHSSMPGTSYANDTLSLVGGIMSFGATGFTVTNDAALSVFANTAGILYTAIVLQDTTSDNRYMQVGEYASWPATHVINQIGAGLHTAMGQSSPPSNNDTNIDADNLGQSLVAGGLGTIIPTAIISPKAYTFSGPAPGSLGNFGIDADPAARTITIPNTTGTVTQVWIVRRSNALVFGADDFTPPNSFSMGTAVVSLSENVTSMGVARFAVGTDLASNGAVIGPYYFVSFTIPVGDPVRLLFKTFKITGTGGTVTAVLGFQPGFVVGRPITAGSLASIWRGPSHTSTDSTRLDAADVPSQGVRAFGATGFDAGTTLAPNGVDTYGFALAASGMVGVSPTPTWSLDVVVTNPDGTTSTLQNTVLSEVSPGAGYVKVSPNADAPQWWCRSTDGYSVFQIDSPGFGWVACVGPATKNGWYLSAHSFGDNSIVISGGKPANPRAWLDIAGWATSDTGMLGGSPQAAAYIDNVMVYPGSGYTQGTDYPPIRLFNGRSDKELCRLPPTVANAIPKAVISLLVANGTVYLTTWDTGTTSADWRGRVFQLDPETGILTSLGTVFAAGEMPYALAWHMGRLWCGTNNGIGTVGKVYYFRPGIDTSWTLDYATSTSSAGGVDSMVSYKGILYVGTDNAAGSRGKVLARDTAGAYTTSQTGSGGTAHVNNGYLAMTVFLGNLYASYWNNDATAISKIEKFDGSSWTTAYTGVAGTLRPFIVLAEDDGTLYAVGGGKLLTAALLSTPNGTAWASPAVELPETDTTLLPMFGPVVN